MSKLEPSEVWAKATELVKSGHHTDATELVERLYNDMQMTDVGDVGSFAKAIRIAAEAGQLDLVVNLAKLMEKACPS